MKKKMILFLVVTLLIASTALPVLGAPVAYGSSGKKDYVPSGNRAVNLDVAITTDWVDGWQDHGLRIREYPLNGSVWAYSEISSDDLYGLYFTQKWWYDNGTGLEFKWDWSWTIGEHWTSSATWSWWEIGLDYGKGVGIIETLVDNVSVGYSNWYAIDNTQPEKPTIDGKTTGKVKTSLEYTFTGTDLDGFKVSYLVDWGDNTTTEWTTFTDSGVPITLNHTWNKKDTYIIKCKVKDLAENDSDWATLSVKIPCSINVPSFPFWEKLLQRFPHAFPLLRHLLGY
jgi:hypothetical protein